MMRHRPYAPFRRVVTAFLLILAGLSLTAEPTLGQKQKAPSSSRESEPAQEQPPAVAQPKEGGLQGVEVNREAGYVDVQAVLIRRKADWLELLATTKGMREHETLLTLKAKPSHMHLGLLMLGLEDGRPHELERVGEGDERKWISHPPQGPPVGIWLIYEHNGKKHKDPANTWIWNRQTKAPLATNRWLFTGSEIVKDGEGNRFYLADRSGTVISLVNFGDDVLARDTSATDRSDNEQWGANTKNLPPDGTKVTIRLKPLEKAQADEKKDTSNPKDTDADTSNQSDNTKPGAEPSQSQ